MAAMSRCKQLGRCCGTAEPRSGSGTAFVDVMQAVQHRAHQAIGRPKPRFGRAETDRAVEPLESTTTATSAAQRKLGFAVAMSEHALHNAAHSWGTGHSARR